VSRYDAALRESSDWRDVREARWAWERVYSGADYVKLLNTFSDHRALPEPNRSAFFQAIAETIERAGGEVRRRYETVLITARKR
jgi:hypothetical protein